MPDSSLTDALRRAAWSRREDGSWMPPSPLEDPIEAEKELWRKAIAGLATDELVGSIRRWVCDAERAAKADVARVTAMVDELARRFEVRPAAPQPDDLKAEAAAPVPAEGV